MTNCVLWDAGVVNSMQVFATLVDTVLKTILKKRVRVCEVRKISDYLCSYCDSTFYELSCITMHYVTRKEQ